MYRMIEVQSDKKLDIKLQIWYMIPKWYIRYACRRAQSRIGRASVVSSKCTPRADEGNILDRVMALSEPDTGLSNRVGFHNGTFGTKSIEAKSTGAILIYLGSHLGRRCTPSPRSIPTKREKVYRCRSGNTSPRWQRWPHLQTWERWCSKLFARLRINISRDIFFPSNVDSLRAHGQNTHIRKHSLGDRPELGRVLAWSE